MSESIPNYMIWTVHSVELALGDNSNETAQNKI